MMKKTISILMMAMMLLTYGGFASFAAVEDTQTPAEEPQVTTEEPAATPETEEPAAPAEEGTEDVQAPEEEPAEPETVDVTEENAIAPSMAEISAIDVAANNKAGYDVSWEAFEGADYYKLFVDGEEVEAELAETEYALSGYSVGSHTVKVEAWATDGETPLASGQKSFDWEDLIADVAAVRAMATYRSVTIKWTPVEGATGYVLYRSGALDGTYSYFKTLKPGTKLSSGSNDFITKDRYGTDFCYFTDYSANGKNKNYFYKVFAYKETRGDKIFSADSPKSGAGKIKSITYRVTLKTSKSLTSHDGKNKKLYLPKGKVLDCSGFGGGKYFFYYTIGGKDYEFRVNAISTKNAKAIYNKKANYTAEEAEWYVNQRGDSSSTGRLIWASLYTQHVYVFSGSKGKWKCIKDFECGSGAANKPSPSWAGMVIHKHIRTRHSRPYWSCFSNINAFHSKLSRQGVGSPASNGCIRLVPANAYYIYYKVPMKSHVVVA